MKKLVIKDRNAVSGKTFEELMEKAEEVSEEDMMQELKDLDDRVLIDKIIDKYIDQTGQNVILNCEVVVTPKGLALRAGGDPEVRNLLSGIPGFCKLIDEYSIKLSEVGNEFALKLQELVCESREN